jgi:hypothetical protein
MAHGRLDLFRRWNNPNFTLRRLHLLFRKSKSARTYSQFPSLSAHVYTSCRLCLIFIKNCLNELFLLELFEEDNYLFHFFSYF